MSDEQNHVLTRYVDTRQIDSNLEPFEDLKGFLSFLLSAAYFKEVARAKHGLSSSEATQRFKRIRPYLCTALEYVDQALNGPERLAFLPAYYAILNLMKVYILLGPYANELSAQQWHGATYESEKDSQNILTEVIKIKEKGAISLFYKTITGLSINKQLRVKMCDVYPYLYELGMEYNLATGGDCRLAYLSIELTEKQNYVIPSVSIYQSPKSLPVTSKKLAVLKCFKKDSAK